MSRHAPHAFELRGGAYRWLWALLPGARMYGAFQLDGRDLVAHATVRRVLEHFRLSPELHRVYIMGHVLPQGSNPTRLLVDVANETDLWEFVHEKASNLFLLVERVAGESPDDSECASEASTSKHSSSLRRRPNHRHSEESTLYSDLHRTTSTLSAESPASIAASADSSRRSSASSSCDVSAASSSTGYSPERPASREAAAELAGRCTSVSSTSDALQPASATGDARGVLSALLSWFRR